jgi:hypothetical protein
MPDTTFHTISYIPGDSENTTRDGDPMWSALPHFLDQGASYERTIDLGLLDVTTLEIDSGPVFDNWMLGDMVDESNLQTWNEANEVDTNKYEENGGMDGPKYRLHNGVSIDLTEDGSGGIDTYDVTYDGASSYSVIEQEDINNVDDDIDSDGNYWLEGAPQPRYYNETVETIDGTETVRVSTVFGGYARAAEEIATVATNEGMFDFLTDTLGWTFEVFGNTPDSDALPTIADVDMGAILANYITNPPNIYHFAEFYLSADGAKYARLWDSSLFPRHVMYLENDRRFLSDLSWEQTEHLNTRFLGFFLQYIYQLTPYSQPRLAYLDKIRNDTSPYTNAIQTEIDDLVEVLPNVSQSDVQDYAEILPSLPTAQFGEDANGNNLGYDEVDNILPDDVMNPFVNETTQATAGKPTDY